MNLFVLLFGMVAGYAVKVGIDRRRAVASEEEEVISGWEGVDPYQHDVHDPEYEPEAIEW